MTDKDKKNKLSILKHDYVSENKPKLIYNEEFDFNRQNIRESSDNKQTFKIEDEIDNKIINRKNSYILSNSKELNNNRNYNSDVNSIKKLFHEKSKKINELDIKCSNRKKEINLINFFINKNLFKYNTLKNDYYHILIGHIIMNRNIHLVAVLKDCMIFDYKDEFLKRYYDTQESYKRLPIFANYYQNYLKFFCIPFFREINFNKITQNHGDNKAELYYVNNYGRRDLTEQNINNCIINNFENSTSNNDIVKMKNILTTTIRENIEETIITKNDLDENSMIFKSLIDFEIYENSIGIFIKKMNERLKDCKMETIDNLKTIDKNTSKNNTNIMKNKFFRLIEYLNIFLEIKNKLIYLY